MLNIKRIVCNPFQENCYILSDDTKESVIIDCGAYFATEREEIVSYIRDNGLKLKHLLATHAHIDHNFGNNTILEFFECKPEIHYDDAALMESLPMQYILFFNSKLYKIYISKQKTKVSHKVFNKVHTKKLLKLLKIC